MSLAFGDYLAHRWRRNQPDLAHAYFWTSGLAALAAAIRGLGIPLVQTFGTLGVAHRHGSPTPAQEGRIRLEACIARSAHAVLAGTSAEAAELIRMGVPRASVTVVPCGVDTDEFTPEGPVAKRNSRPRLLAVAGSGPALRKGQGLETLVRVLARVPGAELLIAGGPARAQLGKDEVHQDLVHQAERFGVADRLSFTGKVAPGGLPALLRSADLLVSAAQDDPLRRRRHRRDGLRHAGRRPARWAVCGMRCSTGPPGCWSRPARPDMLARRVRLLLASPLRVEAFGIAAADRARARYSWDRISRETLAAYERCLRPATTTLVPATS